MKNIALSLLVLVVGFALGWSSHGIAHPVQVWETSLTTRSLADQYLPELSDRASQDMEVLVSLRTNNVSMAQKLVCRDLGLQIHKLSTPPRRVVLSELQQRDLKDAKTFLTNEYNMLAQKYNK